MNGAAGGSCSRGIRLLNGSNLLLVEALLFGNILLLLPLLLLLCSDQ